MPSDGYAPGKALLDIRARIDDLDIELVAILARRVDLIVQAMPYKEGEPKAMEEARRRSVLAHVRDLAAAHSTLLDDDFSQFVTSLFGFMVGELISLQRKRGLIEDTGSQGVVLLTNHPPKRD